MGSVQQFAAFFCICSLIRGAATHTNQDEVKKFNYNPSNPNTPDDGDIYFVEEKRNDDTVKSGRAISQSAWSKEEKEPSRPKESKTDSEFSDESSIKKFLSYLVNAVHELKKDIFGIKEMALKESKKLPNSQDSSEDKGKQNKLEEKQDLSKPVVSTENTELRNRNQPQSSNYLTDYYRENGIKFTDDEENDDDLENFSDVSDDSSHNPNKGARTHEFSKNIENTSSLKNIKIKRNPDSYSFETKKTSAISGSGTKMPEEKVQDFDEITKSIISDDCKKSATETEYNYSKEDRKGTENGKASPPNSKRGKCVKKNNKNYPNYLNKKNEPTEKPLKSGEFGAVAADQNGDSTLEELQRSNQDKNPRSNSKNKNGSDFDNKPGSLVQSTAMPSQNSKDFNSPTDENENEPKASGAHSEKQHEDITSSKTESKKQSQNHAKFWKDNDRISEHTTASYQSHEPVLEIPEHQITTAVYAYDSEINDSPKKSKDEGSSVILSQTIITYNENEPNSETNRQQTSNSFDSGNIIAPTTSGSKINENSSDNLSDKTETTGNDESEQSSPGNDSETQSDDETEQTKVEQVNDDSQPENSLKNKKLIDSNTGNKNKEKYDHADSKTTNDLPNQNSNHEIQNHVKIESDKTQETEENEENLTEKTEVQDSADQEDEDDTVDFDIWDESDSQDSDQNQKSEQYANNEDNDGINPSNTETVLTNESQISQHTGHTNEEKSQEQFDTFLEYFYKHSNNSFFQSLKNQSQSSSEDENAH